MVAAGETEQDALGHDSRPISERSACAHPRTGASGLRPSGIGLEE
jgi:hypothetical protein